MTEPAVGASTWASGNHECRGHMGTLMANAAAKAMKSSICIFGSMVPDAYRSGRRASMVGTLKVSVLMPRKRIAINIRMEPAIV